MKYEGVGTNHSTSGSRLSRDQVNSNPVAIKWYAARFVQQQSVDLFSFSLITACHNTSDWGRQWQTTTNAQFSPGSFLLPLWEMSRTTTGHAAFRTIPPPHSPFISFNDVRYRVFCNLRLALIHVYRFFTFFSLCRPSMLALY